MKLYEVIVRYPQIKTKYMVCAANKADAVTTLQKSHHVASNEIENVKKVTTSQVVGLKYLEGE